MFQLFGSLKTAIESQQQSTQSSSKNSSGVITESTVSRLHYQLTFFTLISFSLLLTANQYFGEPIHCAKKATIATVIDQKLLNAYCLVHSTFTEVQTQGINGTSSTTRIYHRYYQWMTIALFLQAIAFYVPHYIWGQFEGGLVENLVSGLEQPIVDPELRTAKLHQLTAFFERTRKLANSKGIGRGVDSHGRLFAGHLLSEVLNLLNVLGQIVFLDRFLGGQFFGYGWRVVTSQQWKLPFSSSALSDPMLEVFPSVAKCAMDSLDQNNTSSHTVCLLAENILAEKMYLFLWFWLYALLLATVCSLVSAPPFFFVLQLEAPSSVTTVAFCPGTVSRRCFLVQAFLLYLLAKNLSPIHCLDLVASLQKLPVDDCTGSKHQLHQQQQQQFYFPANVEEECEKIMTINNE
ncbi:Structural component of the gap junctions protein [Tyrophagus putrescentiae]|nr:Structural component of the gap junctions protein [Tyrophagus putrescentiae]